MNYKLLDYTSIFRVDCLIRHSQKKLDKMNANECKLTHCSSKKNAKFIFTSFARHHTVLWPLSD